MLEKVELIKSNGEKLNVDLISEFDLDIGGSPKRFVLLTANEIDQNGLVKIQASNISNGKLVRIESDDEWTLVKNVMRSIISKSKGDFTYTNTSDSMSFEVEDNYARVIAVQDSAKQALVKDYSEKKPEPEAHVDAPEVSVDENAAIYPTESEVTPIGSEVVPGIAEMTDNTEENEETPESTPEETPVDVPVESAPSVEEQPTFENVTEEAAPAVEDQPTFENVAEEAAPVVENEATPSSSVASSNDSARDEMINSIIAAVDKYIASKNGNNNVKDTIAKMQEELNKMSEALNTQE